MTFFGAGAMRSIGLTLQTATGEGSAMPRYYFNIYNDDVTLDEEGAELIDAHAAHAHAVHAARSLAADTASRGHIGLSHRIEIEDQDHRLIDQVTFAEAVEIRP
jgi:hypothetical protein